MKTTMAVCLAVLLAPLARPASAQVHVGLFGGANRSYYRPDVRDADFSPRTRVVLGGVVDLAWTDLVGFRAEPAFVQKAGHAEDAALREEVTLSASTLEVPLLVRVGRRTGPRPYLLAGPTLAVVLASDLEGSDSGVALQGDLMDVTRRFHLGVTLGAGLDLPFPRFRAFVESRYVWGLTNMMESGEVELSSPDMPGTAFITVDEDEDEYRYRGLQLLVGFTVPVGGG